MVPQWKCLSEQERCMTMVNPVSSGVYFVFWTRFWYRLTHLRRCLVATDTFFTASRVKLELKMLIFEENMFSMWFTTLRSLKNEYFWLNILEQKIIVKGMNPGTPMVRFTFCFRFDIYYNFWNATWSLRTSFWLKDNQVVVQKLILWRIVIHIENLCFFKKWAFIAPFWLYLR